MKSEVYRVIGSYPTSATNEKLLSKTRLETEYGIRKVNQYLEFRSSITNEQFEKLDENVRDYILNTDCIYINKIRAMHFNYVEIMIDDIEIHHALTDTIKKFTNVCEHVHQKYHPAYENSLDYKKKLNVYRFDSDFNIYWDTDKEEKVFNTSHDERLIDFEVGTFEESISKLEEAKSYFQNRALQTKEEFESMDEVKKDEMYYEDAVHDQFVYLIWKSQRKYYLESNPKNELSETVDSLIAEVSALHRQARQFKEALLNSYAPVVKVRKKVAK